MEPGEGSALSHVYLFVHHLIAWLLLIAADGHHVLLLRASVAAGGQ